MLQKISQGSSYNTGALIPGSVHSDIHFTCSHECLGAHISHRFQNLRILESDVVIFKGENEGLRQRHKQNPPCPSLYRHVMSGGVSDKSPGICPRFRSGEMSAFSRAQFLYLSEVRLESLNIPSDAKY